MSYPCQHFETKLKRSLKKVPPLYYLFCTEKNEHKTLKFFGGFFYGIILGILFYKFVLEDLSFTEEVAFYVTLAICFLLSFGLALSSQIRCITLLTFPNFGGKAGRSVLHALVIAFIIAGPIENMSNNGKEVVRVFSCSASLTFNLTKTRFELMFKPFTQAIFGAKADVNEIKDTLRSIKDVAAPIAGEIEDEAEMRKIKEENDYLDDKIGETRRSKLLDAKYETKGEQTEAERYEKQYLKKIEMRCEDQFTRASQKCRKMFQAGYDKCYDTVTWIIAWLLCWPMKLDFVCNIAQALGGSNRCDPAKDIDPGFGEGYTYLKHSRESLSQNFKDVKMQYKIGKFKQLVDIRDARDTAVAILHEVSTRKAVFNQVMALVKRLLAFMFLRVILDSQKYHDNYLRNIEFDNVYITRYFRKIDARRHLQEKSTVLPLKKIEEKKFVDPWSLKPLKSERESILKATVILLVEMISATIFILLDRLFFEALDIIRRHAKIDYLQTGKHDLLLEVKGTGMIATLLRSIVKGFNVKKRIRIQRSNDVCLPKPFRLSGYYILKIYGTYFVIWLLSCLQAYIQRFRRVICSYFYRKREKKRVLFLYNETLKRRKGFFKFMKKKIDRMVREHRLRANYNIFAILSINHPKKCSWLKIFPFARRHCLVCDDPEPRKNSDFVECQNDTCHFIYCQDCWRDMDGACLACKQTVDDDLSSGIDDLSEAGELCSCD